MPKSRPRSTNKAQWSSDTLSKAEDLINGGSSIRQAAKCMDIPFSSLQKRLKKKDSSEPRLGRQTVFSKQVEKDLANRVKLMAKAFYGCTATQIRKIAFQYAEDYEIKNNFDRNAKMAGRDWLEGFLKRNNISVRKPEATSINRITAFNRREVELFYGFLEELMDKHKFLPQNIYNCDETGISTVQDPGKILAPKGVKRVGSVTSWERGKNITMLCAMSAAGGFVPPMYIFPRKRISPQLEKDGPAGAIYKCSDNGWINENLFFEWLQHFTAHTKPSPEQPILLILDNHASHMSLQIYEHCKKNNIHMLSLPPHTSHRMQPLDVTFFGPFKAAYKRECDLFLKSRLAEKITPYDVAALSNKAYEAVASINKGVSGFRSTGIFPVNPGVFCDEDFLPAEILTNTTDSIATVPMLASTSSLAMLSTPQMDPAVFKPTLAPESPLVMLSTPPMDPAVSVPTLASASLKALNTAQAYTPALPIATPSRQVVAQASPSLAANSSSFFASATPVTQTIPQLLTPPIASTSSVLLSPILAQKNIVSSHTAFERLLPIPEQTACVKTRKGGIKQHAKVLTYTPLKDSLLEKENKKKEKAEKEKYKTKGKKPKECKRKIEDKKTTAKANKRITQCMIVKNKAKRRILQDIQSTSESDSSLHNICDDDEDDDLENIDGIGTSTCLICTEFGRNNEIWYRCTVCGLWAHADCTGWDSAEGYVCDSC